MGQTALLPLRRKACWGFFRPEKSNGFGRVWTRELGEVCYAVICKWNTVPFKTEVLHALLGPFKYSDVLRGYDCTCIDGSKAKVAVAIPSLLGCYALYSDNFPEERGSHRFRGGSLKSRKGAVAHVTWVPRRGCLEVNSFFLNLGATWLWVASLLLPLFYLRFFGWRWIGRQGRSGRGDV